MQILKQTTHTEMCEKKVTLPTELVVLQRERSITSLSYYGRHGDLPGSEVTVVLLAVVSLLNVECCVFAGC